MAIFVDPKVAIANEEAKQHLRNKMALHACDPQNLYRKLDLRRKEKITLMTKDENIIVGVVLHVLPEFVVIVNGIDVHNRIQFADIAQIE